MEIEIKAVTPEIRFGTIDDIFENLKTIAKKSNPAELINNSPSTNQQTIPKQRLWIILPLTMLIGGMISVLWYDYYLVRKSKRQTVQNHDSSLSKETPVV